MRKLMRKKLVCSALVLVLFIILAILYWLGFRITYAPGLENSWDAISAFAAWIGAIGTVLAIFFAIRVANKQNNITLFEKRLNILYTIVSLKEFSDSINTVEFKLSNDESCELANKITMISHMNTCFGLDIGYRDEKIYLRQVCGYVEQLKKTAISVYLLFPFENSEKVKDDTKKVMKSIENIVISIFLAHEVEKMERNPNIYKQIFINEMNEFYHEYYQVIEDNLNYSRW